jgi:hypothetical protein
MLNLYRKHRLSVLITGVFFVVILSCRVQNETLTEPTYTPTTRPTSVQDLSTSIYTPTAQDLSTPELIDQALARGEITEEERLLYLAYALYEYRSLPPQYLSNVGWFGEAAANELYKVVGSPAKLCSMSPHVRNELLRLVKKTNVDTVCN